jgi:hypothetical protein
VLAQTICIFHFSWTEQKANQADSHYQQTAGSKKRAVKKVCNSAGGARYQPDRQQEWQTLHRQDYFLRRRHHWGAGAEAYVVYKKPACVKLRRSYREKIFCTAAAAQHSLSGSNGAETEMSKAARLWINESVQIWRGERQTINQSLNVVCYSEWANRAVAGSHLTKCAQETLNRAKDFLLRGTR